MKNRIRTAAVAGIAGVLFAGTSGPAAAESERMYLHCESGSLAGGTIERANGASWWDVADGTLYTTRSLHVSHPDHGTVYEHTYGRKSAEPETCTASHVGFTWTVELVRAGAR
jgi:hypothetical protein